MTTATQSDYKVNMLLSVTTKCFMKSFKRQYLHRGQNARGGEHPNSTTYQLRIYPTTFQRTFTNSTSQVQSSAIMQNIFITQKKALHPSAITPSSHIPQPQATTSISVPKICLLWISSYKRNHSIWSFVTSFFHSMCSGFIMLYHILVLHLFLFLSKNTWWCGLSIYSFIN